jgi:hypothetical protein
VRHARPCPPPPASRNGPVLPPRRVVSPPSPSATESRRPLPPPLSRAIPVILSSARCATSQLPHPVLLSYPSDEARAAWGS